MLMIFVIHSQYKTSTVSYKIMYCTSSIEYSKYIYSTFLNWIKAYSKIVTKYALFITLCRKDTILLFWFECAWRYNYNFQTKYELTWKSGIQWLLQHCCSVLLVDCFGHYFFLKITRKYTEKTIKFLVHIYLFVFIT